MNPRVADGTQNLVEPTQPLAQRAARGGFWVSALRATTRILVVTRTLVLAALLAPKDFGLIGIAMLAISSIEMFTQTGFMAALVYRKHDAQDYLDTAWAVGLIRGVALFAILFLAAPFIARFFGSPESTSIVRVIGASMVLRGLVNIGVVYFQKQLEFKKQFVYEVTGAVADFVIATSAAVLLRNVWALVLGILAGDLGRCVASYVIHPFRPHLRFQLTRARELHTFGRWVFGSSAILFLITQGDNAFVGKMLGVAALGFYQLAYTISNAPATEITNAISQVTFPAYSQLQDDLPRLGRAFKQVLQITAFASFPLSTGLLVLGPEFVSIFLGAKWIPMIPPLQALSIWGLIRSVGATTGPLFTGTGRPDLVTKLTALQLAVLATVIYPLAHLGGLLGVSVAVLLASLVPNALAVRAAASSLRSNVIVLLEATRIPLFASALMAVVILLAKNLTQPVALPGFLLLAVIGGVTYVAAVAVADRAMGSGPVATIRSLLQSLSGVAPQ